MNLLVIFTIMLSGLLVTNLYYRHKTYRSIELELARLDWNDLPTMQYIKRSYDFVADRFTKVNKCWLKYPWRNFYFKNLWSLKGKGLPCHMQSFLFNRIVAKKIGKDKIKTVATRAVHKGVFIHFYSKIKIKNNWKEVDVWGKKWGIPFGKNIHNCKWWEKLNKNNSN